MKVFKNQFGLNIIVIIIAFTTALPHIYGFLTYGKFYSPLGVKENLQFVRDETFAYAAEVEQEDNGGEIHTSGNIKICQTHSWAKLHLFYQ